MDVLNIYLQKYLNTGIKKEENGNEENNTNTKDSSADVIVKVKKKFSLIGHLILHIS